MHGFATIDYDDGKGSTYRGIELHIGEKIVRYDTGDPVVDFCDYIHGIAEHKLEYVSCSSSFDHWFMDGAKCGKKKVVVLYFDRETYERVEKLDTAKLMRHEYIRLWALSGMKSLDDIRNYIKEKKGLSSSEQAFHLRKQDTTMNTLIEALQARKDALVLVGKIKTYLNTFGWCKGGENKTGEGCFVTAASHLSDDWDAKNALYAAMVEDPILRGLVTYDMVKRDIEMVVEFNDHHDVTFENINELLDRTKGRLERSIRA